MWDEGGMGSRRQRKSQQKGGGGGGRQKGGGKGEGKDGPGQKGSAKRAKVDPSSKVSPQVAEAYASGKYAEWMPDKIRSCFTHQDGHCQFGDSCRFNHKCPKVLSSGKICNDKRHLGASCPNY